MNWITDPEIWIALTTLTLLEIVLGIDNIIFISILSGRLPKNQQALGRRVGLSLALITRVLLLCSLAWVVHLDKPFWTIEWKEWSWAISGKSLVLLFGGLFLVAKSTYEIHHRLEESAGPQGSAVTASFASVIVQILLLDIVFSLDSVITAVGMVDEIWVMIVAVILAMVVMLIFVDFVSDFVERHPTIKMLALSFLILIGVMLVAEGMGRHVPKGYIYFAMAFSAAVEFLNLKVRSNRLKAKEI